jgi:hypothetical protein
MGERRRLASLEQAILESGGCPNRYAPTLTAHAAQGGELLRATRLLLVLRVCALTGERACSAYPGAGRG